MHAGADEQRQRERDTLAADDEQRAQRDHEQDRVVDAASVPDQHHQQVRSEREAHRQAGGGGARHVELAQQRVHRPAGGRAREQRKGR